jgi:hypothetical protein
MIRSTSLQRNRFYPRKLMEVRHWQAEQAYHRRSRELLGRLGLGRGVLCGLEVARTAEGSVTIGSGAAIDGAGRIVIVPHDVEVDVTRLTDDCGRPAGDPVTGGKVAVSLCYHECGTDLVPMPPEQCAGEVSCVASMTLEAFAISVIRTLPGPQHACTTLFDPAGPGVDRHALLDQLDPRTCACDDDCVPLAVVDLDADRGAAPDTTARVVIRSNRQLLDLILCLAERVDECCHPVVVTAPRVTGLWPWPDTDGTARAELAENRRLELAFDHDMAEQGLDDPQAWFGVWLLGPKLARRLPVTRSPGVLEHVTAPAAGDAAAYEVKLEKRWITSTTLVVVMARSAAGGPIQASDTPHLALDADLAGTGLDQGQRDQLWEMPADGSNNPGLGTALHPSALPGPAPFLPSGDGTAGGELHILLQPAAKTPEPPRLLEVWPPGGSVLNNDTPDNAALRKRMRARPVLIIVVSRTLTAEAIATPKAWLRAWSASPDGEFLFSPRELELLPGLEALVGDGGARYTFPIASEIHWDANSQILVQLRSTPPLQTESPLGLDDPQVLLDADFAGTRLDKQTLFTTWDVGPPPRLPALNAISTTGQTLFDGVAGGLAHWGFAVTGINEL